MIRVFSLLLVFSLAIPAISADKSGGGDKKDDQSVDAFAKALAIAQAKVPEGSTLFKARLEGQSSTSVYGFYFMYKNRVIEVEVSKDGSIHKIKNSGNDNVSQDVMKMLTQNKGPVKLPLGRLMEIAKESLKDTPFDGMKYEMIDGVLFLILSDRKINTQTGEVIMTKMKKTA